jgi:hypothetical protein
MCVFLCLWKRLEVLCVCVCVCKHASMHIHGCVAGDSVLRTTPGRQVLSLPYFIDNEGLEIWRCFFSLTFPICVQKKTPQNF